MITEVFTIARPYAEALFSATRNDIFFDTPGLLKLLNQLVQIAAHPEVQRIMSTPNLDKTQRIEIFLSLVGINLPVFAVNFIQLLIDNNRIALLPQIVEQFTVLKNRAEGVEAVGITSALALTAVQLETLVSALEIKFSLKLRPSVTVDPSLIGGIRVVVGDKVLDASVQAQLAHMRDTLMA